MNENLSPSTEWKQVQEDTKKSVTQILDELDRIYGEDNDGWAKEWQGIREEIIGRITETGMSDRDLSRFVAYHGLLSSTTNPEYSPNIDLPGDLSILQQLKATRERLKRI